MLNLENTIIDYLKIDIEESEVQFFQNVLNDDPEILQNVKQIGMEIHHGKSSFMTDIEIRIFRVCYCLLIKEMRYLLSFLLFHIYCYSNVKLDIKIMYRFYIPHAAWKGVSSLHLIMHN